MLGKLICFDVKSSARILLPLHLAALIATVVGRIMLGFGAMDHMPELLLGLMIAAYVILLICAGLFSSFYFVYWFYRNLFTDEGYLMNTLPAHPWQHIFSKLTGMFLWQVIDSIVLTLCVYILLTVDTSFTRQIPVLLGYLLDTVSLEFGINSFKIIFFGLLMLLLSMLVHGLSAFLCITIGQLFNKHRVLAAFIAYFVLSFVVSLLSGLTMSIAGIDIYQTTAISTSVFIRSSTILEIVWNVILVIVYFFVTNLLMERRLNLE